jgi:hypothetical protein
VEEKPMSNMAKHELHALVRLSYLMEEHSFQHLVTVDEQCADFIHTIYVKVDKQKRALQQRS